MARSEVRHADVHRASFRLFPDRQRGVASLDVFDQPAGMHLVSDFSGRPSESVVLGHTPAQSDWLSASSVAEFDSQAGRSADESDGQSIAEWRDQFEITSRADSATEPDHGRLVNDIKERVGDDHRHFYSRDSLCRLGLGVAVAAVMANTSIDRRLTDEISGSQSTAADDFADASKNFGEGLYTLPLFTVAALLGQCADRWPQAALAGNWGSRGLRTVGVGVPTLLVIQRATGGGRPGFPTDGSEWDFFDKPHGASGHTFMGAMPFITAAKMTDDPLLKSGLYVCSTLTGWSRVYHRGHYVSQAMLGWWIAYLAASAVDETESNESRFHVVPLILGEGAGLGIEFRR